MPGAVVDLATAVTELELKPRGRVRVEGEHPVIRVPAEGLHDAMARSGTLIDELIKLAGGSNVVTESGYVAYSSEKLIKADPQVYLATKGSMSDPAALAKRAGYAKLQAVANKRVIILDDNLVSRPGPRIVEGLKHIAAGLHPDAFPGN